MRTCGSPRGTERRRGGVEADAGCKGRPGVARFAGACLGPRCGLDGVHDDHELVTAPLLLLQQKGGVSEVDEREGSEAVQRDREESDAEL